MNTAKKKRKSFHEIRKAKGRQLRFIRRNLGNIDRLLLSYSQCPLQFKDLRYLMIIRTVYDQQMNLYQNRLKSIDHRIVNLHQPHIRPMVRGKDRNQTEFGSKIQVSLNNGFMFIDKLSWEAFNEGQTLPWSVEKYRERFGFYPATVYADRIYCTRENRQWLKERGIKLSAKPLGRPSKQAVDHHVRPGDRNPIEGKFGQAKIAYGLDRIRAKLKETSESWIASIALVLNLLNLRRLALLCYRCHLVQLASRPSFRLHLAKRETRTSRLASDSGFYELRMIAA